MFTMQGKYATARIMTDHVEPEAMSQIYNLLNHPAAQGSQIAIMPDVHAGKGCVVGFTQTVNNYIIPTLVGVDIGCGVTAHNLGKRTIDLAAFDTKVRELIPCGHNVYEDMNVFMKRSHPLLDDKITEICERIGSDTSRMKRSLGTLGGGNHFIELDQAPNGDIWLLVHSGSRKFGLDIAVHHQNKAKELMRTMFVGTAYKDLEFLPMGHGAEAYLRDMAVAQDFADYNRFAIAYILIEACGYTFKDLIVSVHNYIEEDIIRKGAIESKAGELMVIPLNMRDGTIVAMGMGNTAWNCSAPHGAGRIMSRKKAKDIIKLDEYKESMEGIYTSCVGKDTIDEAPMAYKDKQLIIDAIGETAQVQWIMKPIYNFKASE